MTRQDFVRKIARLVEQDVDEGVTLDSLPAWDSMAAIGFIAMSDAELGAAVRPQLLFEAKTVGDLVDLVAEKLE